MKRISHTPLLAGLLLCLTHIAAADTTTDRTHSPATADLVQSCNVCHHDGKAAIPGWPPLKALSKQTLIDKLTAYRNQRDPESRMSDVAHNFTDEEIEQLATYYSQQSQ